MADVELTARSVSVCGNGWHHYTLVASPTALTLYIDGGVAATAGWRWPRSVGAVTAGAVAAVLPSGSGSGGSQQQLAQTHPTLLGMWIGGDAIEAISRRSPTAHAGKGTSNHSVLIADLALLRDTLSPGHLPALLQPDPTALQSASVRHEAWWAAPGGRLAWGGVGPPIEATTACSACEGTFPETPTDVLPWAWWQRGGAAAVAGGGSRGGGGVPALSTVGTGLQAALATHRFLLAAAAFVLCVVGGRATLRRRRSRQRRALIHLAGLGVPTRDELSVPGVTPFKAR